MDELWARKFALRLESAISGPHKVWITRSEPGAQRSANQLAAMGYDALAMPLLAIRPPLAPPPVLPNNSVLIMTSQNGLWALVAETDQRDLLLVCVGDVTARLASDLGFTQVVSAGGTSQDILSMIFKNYPNDPRLFIHVAGETVRGKITETLRERGYRAERHIYYRSAPASIPADFPIQDIQTVLLYSPKSALVLRSLSLDLSRVIAVSISADTDAALGDMVFKQRRTAAAPNEAAMFTMLD